MTFLLKIKFENLYLYQKIDKSLLINNFSSWKKIAIIRSENIKSNR